MKSVSFPIIKTASLLTIVSASLLLPASVAPARAGVTDSTSAGWRKYSGNPVSGGEYGTCFDVSLLKDGALYRMWFSWRPKASVALVESQDGFHWSKPVVVLQPNKTSGWEDDVNRPVVIKRAGLYHMWFTGQSGNRSAIGCATSTDGVVWKRASEKPVMRAEQPWEKSAVMCPDVIWDDHERLYKMWYSGGEQYEPDAIGCATSRDGLTWRKRNKNPVFKSDP